MNIFCKDVLPRFTRPDYHVLPHPTDLGKQVVVEIASCNSVSDKFHRARVWGIVSGISDNDPRDPNRDRSKPEAGNAKQIGDKWYAYQYPSSSGETSKLSHEIALWIKNNRPEIVDD